jgi:putative heme iron utilization protein
MAENPRAVFEQAAKDFATTSRAAVEALPADMRRFAPGSRLSMPWTILRPGAT